MAQGASRLVGRDGEVNNLAQAVASARGGARTLVVIRGGAGLGKSRLVREALARYRGPEDAVGIGYGVELTGPEMPYRVATDLLRTLCRDVGIDEVREAAGPYAPALGPLHPGLTADADHEANPARVLPAFVATLEQLASRRLVWLVLEDLPWIDAASRDLLAYLVRVIQAGRLLVLVTVRTHDPATEAAVTEMVEALTVLDGVTTVGLAPLDAGEVAELVAGIEGGATRERIDFVVREAHGSPLLAEQLVAAGREGQAPSSVSDPMLARMRRLDPDTLRLLQLASLGEGHLEHRLLARAYNAPEAVFDAAVDRALKVGLLGYRTEEREFRFTHPLLRQAADGTLSPGDRIRGHRRWGEVLSSADAHHEDPRLLIAGAHHWGATDDDAQTFTASLAAARETRRLGAASETADLLLRAWGLWDRVPNACALADRPRDDVYLDLAEALQAADRLAEMRPLIAREAARSTADGDDGRVRTLCLRLFAADNLEMLGQPTDESLYDEALARAEELLTAPASRLLVPALNALAWSQRWTDPDLADRCFDRALAASRESGDPTQISLTASQVALQRTGRGRHEEALSVCASALEDCRGVIDFMAVETTRGDVLAQTGQLRAGVAQLDRALARLPDPELAPEEWGFTAMVAAYWRIELGDWEHAAALLEACQRIQLEDWMIGTRVATQASRLACLRGDVDEAARLAEWACDRLGPEPGSVWDVVRDAVAEARARVAAARAEYQRAQQLLEPVLRRPGMTAGEQIWSIMGLAAEIEADRVAAAQRPANSEDAIELVAAVVEELPRTGPFQGTWYRHARANLTRARRSDSAQEWAAVCDGWREVGHEPNLAQASYRLADVLTRSDEREAAAAPLSQAWQIANRLGAVPLRDRVVALSRRARIRIDPGAGRSMDDGRPGGRLAALTDRELEVLRHVAAGMSNNEIAATLFISPKTASVHVSRILTKLQVTSRAKATAVAIEESLDIDVAAG